MISEKREAVSAKIMRRQVLGMTHRCAVSATTVLDLLLGTPHTAGIRFDESPLSERCTVSRSISNAAAF
jgi:hypothetical protein